MRQISEGVVNYYYATIRKNYRVATYTNYNQKYLHDVVVALVAYDIIEEQLKTSNVYTISFYELHNRMNALLARYPRLTDDSI